MTLYSVSKTLFDAKYWSLWLSPFVLLGRHFEIAGIPYLAVANRNSDWPDGVGRPEGGILSGRHYIVSKSVLLMLCSV